MSFLFLNLYYWTHALSKALSHLISPLALRGSPIIAQPHLFNIKNHLSHGVFAWGWSKKAHLNGEQVGIAPTIQPRSNSNLLSQLLGLSRKLEGWTFSRPMTIHILVFNKYCPGLKFKEKNLNYQMELLMGTFSFSTSLSPAFLLVLSSFKRFSLSIIPNAHIEANISAGFLPGYESFM